MQGKQIPLLNKDMEKGHITTKMRISVFNTKATGKMELSRHNLDRNQLSQSERDPNILHNMQENSVMVKSQVSELKNGQMEKYIEDNSLKVKCMEADQLFTILRVSNSKI